VRHAEHDREHAVRQPRIVQCARHGERRARRLLRGLEDARAARGERGADLARRIAEREIPRRERRHRADRFLHDGHALARQALRQHAAVRAPSLVGIPVEDLGADLQLDARLVDRLAHLERRDARDLLAARAQVVRGAAQDLRALHRQQRAPQRPGALRGRERALEIGRRRMRQLPEQGLVRGIYHGLRAPPGGAGPLAVDVQRELGIRTRGRGLWVG
jgi:hypothetical protein